MRINLERLMRDLESYAQYGKDPLGGITRPSFSEADQVVRERYIGELQKMGLEVTIDGMANIWGRWRGSGEKKGSIVIGSHLDTVPNGGKYDGALGVLAAKEVLMTLMENDITLQHDIEIVSFTAEESNDFKLSTLGSRAFTGRLSLETLKEAADSKGNLLSEAVLKVNGDLDRVFEFEALRKEKKVFVELHIEQGKRLESQQKSVAIIDNMVGVYRCNISVTGEANHSGTTMMNHRSDALTAAAEMVLAVERVCREDETDLVGTVGELHVKPNAVNIIPGQVEFVLEIRGGCYEGIQRVVNDIGSLWEEIAANRNVSISRNVFMDQKPVDFDSEVISILKEAAQELSEPYLTLSSMAVHDAAHMSTITKTAMLFVKSINGISHSPLEYTTPEDIENASNVLLHGVRKLDEKLK